MPHSTSRCNVAAKPTPNPRPPPPTPTPPPHLPHHSPRYDPYGRHLLAESYDHAGMRAARRKAVQAATGARRWGVVMGTLGRQGNPRIVEHLEGRLRAKGLTYTLVLLSEVRRGGGGKGGGGVLGMGVGGWGGVWVWWTGLRNAPRLPAINIVRPSGPTPPRPPRPPPPSPPPRPLPAVAVEVEGLGRTGH